MALEILKIRRRTSGAAGPPATLQDGELAFNEMDAVLYYGSGVSVVDGLTAISVIAVAGAAKANIDSPTFTGTPSAPTAAPGTNTTQLATTAFAALAAASATIVPSAVVPTMNGTGAVGVAAAYSRGDHVHPVDTSRYAANNPSAFQTSAQVTTIVTGYGYQTAGQVTTAITAYGYQTAPQVTTALAPYAPLASPALTGTPSAPTAASTDNTTTIATTAYVTARITSLINAAPAAFDTLGEIATQLASDESAASALATTVASKAPLASPTFTGSPTVPGYLTTASASSTYALIGSVPGAASTAPVMDGTATVGVSTLYARQDHVHPVDTSRYAANNPSAFQTSAQVAAALAAAGLSSSQVSQVATQITNAIAVLDGGSF